eukprot:TRINITY_DN3117_c0_g1_i2.p1 TRINITY_DN3117_c0_g1~~TRINITY_DN3117_c0_g1_i2.p1  ORF type:complete len:108 (+),score=2.58 TRINITY_DN3117_c0_g1_i2:273-596(+)
MIISAIELFIMNPLCLLVSYAIIQNKWWRAPLEIVTCTLQIMGTLVYVGTEWLYGWKHIEADSTLSFTPHHLFYFWLCFVVANPIWIITPLLLIIRAFNSLKPVQLK